MAYVIGTTQILAHCTFRWHERLVGGQRVVEVEPEHCERCIAEVRASMATIVLVPSRWPSGTKPPAGPGHR